MSSWIVRKQRLIFDAKFNFSNKHRLHELVGKFQSQQ
jgi:hypothetical protein